MIIYIYINCSKNSNRESTGGPYIPMALALMLGSGVFNPGWRRGWDGWDFKYVVVLIKDHDVFTTIDGS